MCIKVVGSSQKVCCPIHPAIASWNKTFHSIAGGKRGRSCRCSGCAMHLLCLFRLALSCRLRRLAKWCEMVQMVSAAKQPRYTTAMFHSNQPETFPLSAGVSRPYLPQQASSSRQAAAGKQQQQQAAASSSSSRSSSRQAASKQASSRGKQQRQAAAASSSRGKQQQQQQQEQQAAAAASSRQAAAGKQQASSSKQAASKQQPAFAPLKEWTNISFKNQRDTQKWTDSRRTALKQWNRSITKSCDDAKLELFPGARPPDTTFRSWYDLTLALVCQGADLFGGFRQ